MNNQEYKECIIQLLNRIDDNLTLRSIYVFINWKFINIDRP